MASKSSARKEGDPAWLPSEGFSDGRVTLHTFVRRQEVSPDDLHYSAEHGPRGIRPGIALIFRCEATGHERRWGIE